MSNARWKYPFHDCIVAVDISPDHQTLESPDIDHGMICVVLDLRRFTLEIEKLVGQQVIERYLSRQEQKFWRRLTSAKRKREWLGGRFAAKYAAAQMIARPGDDIDWFRVAVHYDNNGRPVLAAEGQLPGLPDISISHSADLTAAMAVSSGLCGLDIQKITDRVARVQDRFCSEVETEVIRSFFRDSSDQHHSTLLTMLWAAKEALRKVEKTSVLPGFMELELRKINEISQQSDRAFWKLIFTRKYRDRHDTPCSREYAVGVRLIEDYVLAVTTVNESA